MFVHQSAEYVINHAVQVFGSVDLFDGAACIAHQFDHVMYKPRVEVFGFVAVGIPQGEEMYFVDAFSKGAVQGPAVVALVGLIAIFWLADVVDLLRFI